MQRDLGDGVEEFAVMADHHQRARVTLEPGFEPDEGVEVKVVGRLVEQQNVGRAHQGAGQLQTHPPTAGKTVDRLFSSATLKPRPRISDCARDSASCSPASLSAM